MKGFELIACLLMAEKNNELLIKNHQDMHIGTTTVLEVNVVNNHMCGRIGRRRNNRRVHQCAKDNIFWLKNTYQKRGRNIKQFKI